MNNLKILNKQQFMGKEIPVIEGGFGEGKRCLTDKTIAEIHNMESRNVRARISDNIKRFKENVDFIDLKSCLSDKQQLLLPLGYSNMQISKAEHIYLLSERGYAKLIKIMDTDLAWEIHDKLIDEYFTMREVINSNEQLKGMALLKATEGKTVEERLNGITTYTNIRIEEETKPLIETINQQDNIIDSTISNKKLFDIGVVGKILKPYCKQMGEKKIFNFLHEKKILINRKGTQKHNNPYDKYRNYFEIKMIKRRGFEKTYLKSYFTGEGLKWFLKNLAKEGYIENKDMENINEKILNSKYEIIEKENNENE